MFDGLKISFLPIILLLVLFAAGPAFGWPWSTDMMYQPSIKPYEEPLPYPDLSVTNKGIRVDPIVPREVFEEMTVNPVIPDDASMEKAAMLFKNFCAPCHGPEGKGDGPVVKKGFYPVNLTAPQTQDRTDGYIYAYIRFGGKVMMPSYRESVSERDAWDLVNYVRKLQGKLK